MKAFILGSLLISTASFAQSIDINGFKKLLTSKQETLEKINPGMSKKTITTASEGACGYRNTSIQTVLKIEGDKVIILSNEKFQPQNTEACRTAGYTESTEQSVLYFESKPSLENDLSDLDASASQIKAISRAGNIVTMHLETEGVKVTVKYDITKPSFKNLISSQSQTFSTIIEEMADADLTKVDLSNVLFCDNNDGDESECTQGNYSDILF